MGQSDFALDIPNNVELTQRSKFTNHYIHFASQENRLSRQKRNDLIIKNKVMKKCGHHSMGDKTR